MVGFVLVSLLLLVALVGLDFEAYVSASVTRSCMCVHACVCVRDLAFRYKCGIWQSASYIDEDSIEVMLCIGSAFSWYY